MATEDARSDVAPTDGAPDPTVDPFAEPALRDYFDRYAGALVAFDAEAAAQLWSAPGMIVGEEFSDAVGTRAEMVAGLAQSYPLYERLGLADVDYDLLGTHRISGRLALIRIRWRFLDSRGELLTDSTSEYLLRAEGEPGLQATVCVETDSQQKLVELAERLGIDLSDPQD